MSDDFTEALEASHRKVLALQVFLDRSFKIHSDKKHLDDPRHYDVLIRATLDLLGALILAKADAEVFTRFRKA